jgi:hypothetical protein
MLVCLLDGFALTVCGSEVFCYLSALGFDYGVYCVPGWFEEVCFGGKLVSCKGAFYCLRIGVFT